MTWYFRQLIFRWLESLCCVTGNSQIPPIGTRQIFDAEKRKQNNFTCCKAIRAQDFRLAGSLKFGFLIPTVRGICKSFLNTHIKYYCINYEFGSNLREVTLRAFVHSVLWELVGSNMNSSLHNESSNGNALQEYAHPIKLPRNSQLMAHDCSTAQSLNVLIDILNIHVCTYPGDRGGGHSLP